MAGSGGVVVMDDTTDMVALCARIMQFYAHESCGQCTPCREGTGWLARVTTRLATGEGSRATSSCWPAIAHGIAGNTICPLGEAAAWPMLGFLTKFRAEFEAKMPTARNGGLSRRWTSARIGDADRLLAAGGGRHRRRAVHR